MNLYIREDVLMKAERPATSKDTELEDQSSLEYDSSYSRRYEGVASGEAYDPDDPKVGKEWDDSGETNLSDVEQKRSSREKKDDEQDDKQQGAGAPQAESTSKSLDILKSFNSRLEAERAARVPNPVEVQFLTEELGYDYDDVMKGHVIIKGRLRSLFTDWLCGRVSHSATTLMKRRR